MNVRVAGDCMAPLFRDGDEVEVETARVYWPGDVVLVQRKRGFQAHRFLGYRPSTHGVVVITQGDHEPDADAAASVERVWGRVHTEVSAIDRLMALQRYAVSLWRTMAKVHS